jgi:hypothetical protein
MWGREDLNNLYKGQHKNIGDGIDAPVQGVGVVFETCMRKLEVKIIQ